MSSNQGRVGATLVGIIAIVVIFLLVLKPGSSHHAATDPSTNTTAAKGEQRFSGQGTTTLGTIHVATTSEATFDCPQCQGSGFAITSTDPANPVAGLNDASPDDFTAQFEVSAGTYSDVHVNSHGNPWTLTITPGNHTTTGSGY